MVGKCKEMPAGIVWKSCISCVLPAARRPGLWDTFMAWRLLVFSLPEFGSATCDEDKRPIALGWRNGQVSVFMMGDCLNFAFSAK